MKFLLLSLSVLCVLSQALAGAPPSAFLAANDKDFAGPPEQLGEEGGLSAGPPQQLGEEDGVSAGPPSNDMELALVAESDESGEQANWKLRSQKWRYYKWTAHPGTDKAIYYGMTDSKNFAKSQTCKIYGRYWVGLEKWWQVPGTVWWWQYVATWRSYRC